MANSKVLFLFSCLLFLWPCSTATAQESVGTGFAVSADGLILTNAHVIKGCSSVTVRIIGVELPATMVSTDPQNDLALLKVSGPVTAALPFREMSIADANLIEHPWIRR